MQSDRRRRSATSDVEVSGASKGASGRDHSSSLSALPGPVRDFSSFMMFFNDMFLQDEYYSNFNLTNDLPMSSIIGQGTQFSVKRLALQGGMAVRTSADPQTRMTNGDNIVLKKPRLDKAFGDRGEFSESRVIDGIVQELRILSHPPLRTQNEILDVYGFAWELDRTHKFGEVWPVLMVEYAALGTLQDCLENMDPLSLDKKLDLAFDVGGGLAALHSCGIVHSDLKPSNVLVCTRADGGLTAKLADFGLSIIIKEADQFEPWNRGTPGWMAPEWGTEVPLNSLYKTDSECMLSCLSQ
jgi:serine/threonine protein kinase